MITEYVELLFNAPHDIPLKINIAIYFYLTGISAASFLISSIAYVFGRENYKPAGKIGAIAAPVVLIIAPIFLIIDLEQPLRFIHLMYMFNLRSPITYGSALLTLYPINCLIYLYFIYTGDVKKTKLFGTIGIPLAVMVHGYTGFILALAKGITLWNTALMPIYFLISAMVSGAALLILLCVIKEKYFAKDEIINKYFPKVEDDIIRDIGKMLAVFLALDLFVVTSDVLVLLTSGPENYAAATMLLRGAFSLSFLWIEIIAGSIIPLIILLIPKLNKSIPVLSFVSLLVLIGVFAMRYVTVLAGQYIPLT